MSNTMTHLERAEAYLRALAAEGKVLEVEKVLRGLLVEQMQKQPPKRGARVIGSL